MAKRLAHKLLSLCGAMLCAALLWGNVAHAAGVDLQDLRNRMADLKTRLNSDPTSRIMALDHLLDEIGLPSPKTGAGELPLPPRVSGLPTGPARSEVQNLRLALAILAQSHSGKDNLDVVLAQGPRGLDALTFRGGAVTLEDIRAALQKNNLPPLSLGPGGVWVLSVPVVLWEDTVLRLGPRDRLALSRPDGAFILSFGMVKADGTELSVTGDENIHAPDFVPFLAVGGGGALQMEGAHVTGLGFGTTGKFSGVAIAAHPLMRPVGRSRLRDNVFTDMMTLAVTGNPGVQLSGNRFFDMRHNALLLSGSPMARVSGNLFFGDAVTNAIRVLNGSSDAVVEANYILEGDRAAIIVEGNSMRVRVLSNVIANRSGGGIKFFRTRCGVASGNVVLDMRQKGIEVRTSRDTTVSANLIAGSRSAGIWVSAQPKGAITHVSDNVLLRNDAGINTATGGVLFVAGNDLSDQFPRLVKGDIALQNAAFVRDLRGEVPLRLTGAQAAPADLVPFDCGGGLGQ